MVHQVPSVALLAVATLSWSIPTFGTGIAPWMNPREDPIVRATKLVAAMTTDEKLALFHGSCGGYTGNVCGNSRLGIPQLKYNDGPQGFRDSTADTTSWPAALTVASAWNVSLANAWGQAMGVEFYGKGANVQLGPGACVSRVPRNGRTFEYLSGEDPFVGYYMTAAVVTGIQSKGVVANVKHYVNNNQETQRSSISENVDERTQFEIYYPPFEGASNAGLGSIMCSYNKICQNCGAGSIGNWSCENHDTLQRDLKDRIGFKGFVMSDWGATHSASMNQGLDQEMPGSKFMGDTLAGMVKSGAVTAAKVDDSAIRILWPFFAVGLFDKNNTNSHDNNVTSAEHTALARKISSEATVLLKNTGNVLPIKGDVRTIAIIGGEAENPQVHGGGSGSVLADVVSTPLAAIRSKFGIAPAPPVPNNCSQGHYDVGFDYRNQDDQSQQKATSPEACCQLCGARTDCTAFTYQTEDKMCYMKADASNRIADKACTSGICSKGPAPSGNDCNDKGVCVKYNDGSVVADAVTLARSADVVVVFAATNSHEGSDRADLSLGSQDALIAAVANASAKTVVVVVTPGPVLTPWRDAAAAVVTPMMPGQEYGNAIADVLLGDTAPSGKLLVTFPAVENEMKMSEDQWPGVNGWAYYSEKLEVGYRWYAAHPDVKPAYAFGHGLTYTTFTYSELAIDANTKTVSFHVQNSGSNTGSEVAQLYIEFPAAAGEPPKQLKEFSKFTLAPGESTGVVFKLSDRSFSIWDVTQHAWALQAGDFGIMVGSSSDDIRLKGTLQISAI